MRELRLVLYRSNDISKKLRLKCNFLSEFFTADINFYLFHSILLEKYITALKIANKPILPTSRA